MEEPVVGVVGETADGIDAVMQTKPEGGEWNCRCAVSLTTFVDVVRGGRLEGGEIDFGLVLLLELGLSLGSGDSGGDGNNDGCEEEIERRDGE